jgi:hypothetical protein
MSIDRQFKTNPFDIIEQVNDLALLVARVMLAIPERLLRKAT